MSNIQLKPCPFCGEKALAFTCAPMIAEYEFAVRCAGNVNVCPSLIEMYGATADEAARNWNRRRIQ